VYLNIWFIYLKRFIYFFLYKISTMKSVRDALKKAVSIGAGAATTSKKKVQQFTKDLEKKGIISGEEAAKLYDDIVSAVEKNLDEGAEALRVKVNAVAKDVAKTTSSKKKTRKAVKKAVKKAKKTVKKVKKKVKKKVAKKKAVKKKTAKKKAKKKVAKKKAAKKKSSKRTVKKKKR